MKAWWHNGTDYEADLKATALLKLIYLEMFGHDMSWASFHVLEVMSSPKYHQKRVGYLGAVQSFRPDTEVLMLATNLLKKVTSLAEDFSVMELMGYLGYQFTTCDDDVVAFSYTSSYHHVLISSFTPLRSIAKTVALKAEH